MKRDAFRRALTFRAARVREIVGVCIRGYVQQQMADVASTEGYIRTTEDSGLTADAGYSLRVREWWGDIDDAFQWVGCQYVLLTDEGREVIAFHRHLGQFGDGHYHLGPGVSRVEPFDKAHVPAPGVTLELFVEMLITEFGVRPLRPDWRAILDSTST